jgi:hypothetical protein
MNDDKAADVAEDATVATMSLASCTIADVERDLATLTTAHPEADVLRWLNLSDVLLDRAHEIRQRVERVTIDWIIENGRIQCGTTTYSVGRQKQVKCSDALRCMELLLAACGGNVEELCTYFRSDPFRYGACGQVLSPSQWNSAFVVEWQDKLVLKRTDPRFLP